MSEIDIKFKLLRKKRRRMLYASIVTTLILSPLAFLIIVGNPLVDKTKYSNCDYQEVLGELKYGNPAYQLPAKSSIPLENVFAINLTSAYNTLYEHAMTHPRGERVGDFVKDRCRFLVEQVLEYRVNDSNLLSNDLDIMLVKEGNFKDLSAQILIKDVKYCLGVTGKGNLSDFEQVKDKILFFKGGCRKFFKNNFYTTIEDLEEVIFPPDNLKGSNLENVKDKEDELKELQNSSTTNSTKTSLSNENNK